MLPLHLCSFLSGTSVIAHAHLAQFSEPTTGAAEIGSLDARTDALHKKNKKKKTRRAGGAEGEGRRGTWNWNETLSLSVFKKDVSLSIQK